VLALNTGKYRVPDDHLSQSAQPILKEKYMGISDKAKHAAESTRGKAKETAGKATGNDSLRAEGETDQANADLKKAGESVKDAFKH
jgi:uncharacterized protein YjbJ (UPF0337 family)